MTSSRDGAPARDPCGAHTEGAGSETSARDRVRNIVWMVLAACSLLLAYFTLRHSHTAGTANLGLWELHDSRRVLAWMGSLAFGALCEFACFIPVGFSNAMVVRRGLNRLGRLTAGIIALATAVTLTVSVWAIATQGSRPSTAPVDLALPLFGGLLGTWAGFTWLRGRRARLWLLPKVALVVILVVLSLGVLLWQSLEAQPLSFDAAPVTSAEKRRLVDLVRSKDPTSLEEGRTHTLRLTEHDLNVLLSWGLSLGAQERKARIRLERNLVWLHVSGPVPLRTDRPRYLNLTVIGRMGIKEGIPWLEVVQCRLGSLEVPRRLLRSLIPLVISRLCEDRGTKPFLDATRQMAVEPGFVEITYGPLHLPSELRREVFGSAAASAEVRASTRAQVEHLLAVIDRLRSAPPSFGLCLETVFALARERSAHGNPVLENRAGIFALGIVLGHPRIAEFLGSVSSENGRAAPRAHLRRVALRGRYDWTRHFCVSAVIALLSDEGVSAAAGLLKEEFDADIGGSGFSFSDLLADRAGTVFAVRATRDEASARAMQERLAGGFRVDEFFPPAADLPERIPDTELQSRYGGVGGKGYLRLMAEIERRIEACAAYR